MVPIESARQRPYFTSKLKTPRSDAVFSCVMMLIAATFMCVLQYAGPRSVQTVLDPPKLHSLEGLTALIVSFTFVLTLHEAGHLVGAIAMRFELLALSLGPFRVARLHGNWSLQFNARRLFSASVSAVPRTNRFWRVRTLVVVGAGPAATLLSGMACAYVTFSLHPTGWARIALTLVIQLSLLLFLAGLAPNGARARVRNDSQFCCSLLRNGKEAHGIYLYHSMTQLIISGIRPRDYPESIIRQLAEIQERPDMALLCADTIVQWAIDSGRLATADAWDCRAMDLRCYCSVTQQHVALAKSACFDLLFRGDMGAAKAKFASQDFRRLSPWWLNGRAKAANHLVEGRTGETLAEISRTRQLFPKGVPYYEFEESLVSRLEEKASAPARHRVSAAYSA
ncbi:MAG: hypothetical protein WBW33_14930 [Bryobacteraceae bacterium]